MTATCTQIIRCQPEVLYESFTQPEQTTRFWLAKASAPLVVGKPADWEFMVPGTKVITTATSLVAGKVVSFDWSDGKRVRITFDASQDESVVTVEVSGIEPADVAATVEGFSPSCQAILIETGKSPGLSKDKARLTVQSSADARHDDQSRPGFPSQVEGRQQGPNSARTFDGVPQGNDESRRCCRDR